MNELSKKDESKEKESLNFIEQIIEEDIRRGKHSGRVHTRFQFLEFHKFPSAATALHGSHSIVNKKAAAAAFKYMRFTDIQRVSQTLTNNSKLWLTHAVYH